MILVRKISFFLLIISLIVSVSAYYPNSLVVRDYNTYSNVCSEDVCSPEDLGIGPAQGAVTFSGAEGYEAYGSLDVSAHNPLFIRDRNAGIEFYRPSRGEKILVGTHCYAKYTPEFKCNIVDPWNCKSSGGEYGCMKYCSWWGIASMLGKWDGNMCAVAIQCGNGVIDKGEYCDLGKLNGVPGSGCSSLCCPEPPTCQAYEKLVSSPCSLPKTEKKPRRWFGFFLSFIFPSKATITGKSTVENLGSTNQESCTCFACKPKTCDEFYGVGNWIACPKGKVNGQPNTGNMPFCCRKDSQCNAGNNLNWKNKDEGACCPPNTIPGEKAGYRYCIKEQKYCDEIYGSGWTACMTLCCAPGTICIQPLASAPRCVYNSCPKGTSECGKYKEKLFFDTAKPQCCNDETEVCRIIDPNNPEKTKACVPKDASKCKTGETYCRGIDGTTYERLATCCPINSLCINHPDGSPLCIKTV